MTIYKEIYYELTDLLRFYRFEGNRSFPFFNLSDNDIVIVSLKKLSILLKTIH